VTCSIEQFKRGKDSVSASVSVSRNAANAGIAGTPRRPHVRTEKYKMKRPESPGSEKTLGSAFKSARLRSRRSRRLPAFSAFAGVLGVLSVPLFPLERSGIPR